jgi:hypothetical protein
VLGSAVIAQARALSARARRSVVKPPERRACAGNERITRFDRRADALSLRAGNGAAVLGNAVIAQARALSARSTFSRQAARASSVRGQ